MQIDIDEDYRKKLEVINEIVGKDSVEELCLDICNKSIESYVKNFMNEKGDIKVVKAYLEPSEHELQTVRSQYVNENGKVPSQKIITDYIKENRTEVYFLSKTKIFGEQYNIIYNPDSGEIEKCPARDIVIKK